MGDFDNVEYSKSTGAEIDMCPMHFKLRRIDKRPTAINPYAAKGIKVHRFLRLLHEGKMEFDQMMAEANDDEISDWVSNGISTDPFWDCRLDAKYEHHIRINEKGELLSGKKPGYAHGYLDQLIPPRDGILDVVDWKTDFDYMKDDPAERDSYAFFGLCEYPDVQVIRFNRFNVRHKVNRIWTYEIGKNSLLVTHPGGHPVEQRMEKGQPLLNLLHERVRRMRSRKLEPTPGPHCENWFGVPCDFLGTYCPLARDVQVVSAKTLNLTADALQAITTGEMPITVDLAPQLLSGSLQLKGFLKALEEQIKKYAKENGPIAIGDKAYGFTEGDVFTVDKVTALKTMITGGMSVAEIAKVVKLDASGLRGVNFDQWPEVKEAIEAAISFKHTRSTFGPM